MMSVRFRKTALISFLEAALSANIAYYNNRRTLKNLFDRARLRHSQRVSESQLVRVPRDKFTSIVATLSKRNEQLNDNDYIAFPNHLLDIETQIEDQEDEELSDHEDHDDDLQEEEEEEHKQRPQAPRRSSIPPPVSTQSSIVVSEESSKPS